MVGYQKKVLPNGLRVIFHSDTATPMAVVSVLYDVGSKDEETGKTGYAHLFEHLMFSGSQNAPDFDEIMQDAGGENNAYTNNDMTHFYSILPAQNLATALFLEADRMENLTLSKRSFETQKKVVLEEFMETCINQPYGDAWHHILEVNYQTHPYQWPTIGRTPEHIENAQYQDVCAFFDKYYHPGNAILAIGGNFEWEEVQTLVDRYFAHIPAKKSPPRAHITEPQQRNLRRKQVTRPVPHDTLYMTFKMAGRTEGAFYTQDILSDLLANGSSTRLISNLTKEDEIFNSIDCYVFGSTEPGLFIIEGQVAEEVSPEEAEIRVWQELEALKDQPVPVEELNKQLNKVRTHLVLSETSVLNKVMSLAYFELLGDIDLINREEKIYSEITPLDIHNEAKLLFQRENCSIIHYRPAHLKQSERQGDS